MQQLLAYSTNHGYDQFVTIDSLVRHPPTARGYEHAIDVNGSTRLTGVFADVRAARGENVRLRLGPAGCHLFPADQ